LKTNEVVQVFSMAHTVDLFTLVSSLADNSGVTLYIVVNDLFEKQFVS